MVESIQLREGVLSLTVALPRAASPGERERGIQFDFGESGTVTELHDGQLMDFLQTVHPEGAYEVSDLIFELVGAHTRVRRIHLNCVYRPGESLKDGAAPDVSVQFPGGAIESAGSEEDIPF